MDFTKILFSGKASSLKVIDSHTDSITISNSVLDSSSHTIPHGYGSDDIIVTGFINSTYSTVPGENFGYGLPYVNASGKNLVQAEWDDTNVYIKVNNRGAFVGAGTGTWTVTYTILIIVP